MEDVAEAVVRLATEDAGAFPGPVFGERLDLGGPEVVSLRELLERILRRTGRKARLLPVPFGLVSFLSAPLVALPKPPITPDQVLLLREDNTCRQDGFAALGMAPEPLDFRLGAIVARFAKPYALLEQGESRGAPARH